MSKETLKNKKWLALLSLSLSLGLMVFWAQAQTTRRPTPTPTPEKKITINDTIARREGKNKVTLKSEFEAVKQSGNSAVPRRRTVGVKTSPGIDGKFQCECFESGGGTCTMTVSGPSLVCSGCKDNCTLTVVVK